MNEIVHSDFWVSDNEHFEVEIHAVAPGEDGQPALVVLDFGDDTFCLSLQEARTLSAAISVAASHAQRTLLQRVERADASTTTTPARPPSDREETPRE